MMMTMMTLRPPLLAPPSLVLPESSFERTTMPKSLVARGGVQFERVELEVPGVCRESRNWELVDELKKEPTRFVEAGRETDARATRADASVPVSHCISVTVKRPSWSHASLFSHCSIGGSAGNELSKELEQRRLISVPLVARASWLSDVGVVGRMCKPVLTKLGCVGRSSPAT